MEQSSKEKALRSKLKKSITACLIVILIFLVLKSSKEFLLSLSAISLSFVIMPVIIDNDVYTIIKKIIICLLLSISGIGMLLIKPEQTYQLNTYLILTAVIIIVSFIKYEIKIRKHKY